ncbi:unnamed protein product [Spirodela intermedia]|uniref:Glycosyltransferases n=1 Tax=Spirodela intermedia TaxID=51605 RepID=A0A7I8K158_SPIIN|nr:unnamed protein product [Spirodela intermedia]
MGPLDRTKKRIQPWRKAILHVSLCFAVGFFMGFSPSSTNAVQRKLEWRSLNDSSTTAAAAGEELPPQKLLIAVTTTRRKDPLQDALLRWMADALSLVPPPLLWLVVESQSEMPLTAELLRKTTVMYRHLPSGENFTDPEAELRHQRNVALRHIEKHRIDGIVHFSPLTSVYDLRLFDGIRETEVLGAWPTASVAANGKTVVVDGPVCRSSRVVGWRPTGGRSRNAPSVIDISSFAFNSSILWHPSRWHNHSSPPDVSQDSISFLQQMALKETNKTKAIPTPGCSRIVAWRLPLHRLEATSPVRSEFLSVNPQQSR